MNGHKLIDEAIQLHNPIAVYGLLSGGDDSMTAVHLAATHPKFNGVIHINTGIGVKETRQHVRETCAHYSWKLWEIRAKEDCGQDYVEIVKKYGFPGPGAHAKMYIQLKERCLEFALRNIKKGFRRRDCVLFISGVRSQESDRRMGYVEPIQKDGSMIWVAVIHDFSKTNCLQYLAKNQVKRNPVSQNIHKSGECLCGAFAKAGELEELRFFYPETAAEIDALNVQVADCGHKRKWGEAPKKKPKKIKKAGMLCFSCDKNQEPT